eukprot:12528125-Prorocentrum_lima.AAC.1
MFRVKEAEKVLHGFMYSIQPSDKNLNTAKREGGQGKSGNQTEGPQSLSILSNKIRCECRVLPARRDRPR